MTLMRRLSSHLSVPLVVVLVLLVVLPLASCGDPPPAVDNTPKPVYCPLCGKELPAGTDLTLRPLMVMMDNHPDARPQAGLTDACLVIEALAEGGVTRIVPVFVHGAPERLGPVRSARHYFLDLALGLDALYAHCGQSPQAMVDIAKLKIADLNEFTLTEYFWRDAKRVSPHNLFTSVAKLRAAAAAKKLRGTQDTAGARWPYGVAASGTAPQGEASLGFELAWPYSSGRNVVTFRYVAPAASSGTAPAVAAIGQYVRSVNGNPHNAEEIGQPLRATNVVVVSAPFWRIEGDTDGRLDADLTGSGKAMVYSGGKALPVSWRKAERASPLVLVDAAGQQIKLPAGQTWMLIVPEGAQIKALTATGG